jgi:hypothetical protein
MQEEEDDMDIPAPNTTTPMGQQEQQDRITRNRLHT